jgi:uncharacterized protein YegL
MNWNPTQGPSDGTDWGEELFEAGLEFADNPEPRCPCVLVVDTSGSMRGQRITALAEGLQAFRDGLLADPLARKRVEVAVVTFGGSVQVAQDFVTVEDFNPPTLQTGGLTPIGTAVHKAIDLLDVRKAQYKMNAVAYYRPWVFLITDGAPEGEPPDVVQSASRRIREEEQARRVAFFCVGVAGADMTKLAALSPRTPVKLQGLRFVDMFVWLSRSAQCVANSRLGEAVALPPVDWGTV